MAHTDEELMLQFQNGDTKGFDELMNRYQERLYLFIFRFVKESEGTYDVLQDTFFKVYTKKHQYRPIAKVSTWMYTIAANCAKVELRKRKKENILQSIHAAEKLIDIPIESKTLQTINSNEVMGLINAAIAKLPEVYREAVILIDLEGFSYAEVGSMLKIPENTAKTRVLRGRHQLSELLKDLKGEV